jgi:hypothetical protein
MVLRIGSIHGRNRGRGAFTLSEYVEVVDVSSEGGNVVVQFDIHGLVRSTLEGN